MKVFWGLYESNKFIESQLTGRADDIASIFVTLIPLFCVLSICFLYKELEFWFEKRFHVTIHLTKAIKKEIERFKIRDKLR